MTILSDDSNNITQYQTNSATAAATYYLMLWVLIGMCTLFPYNAIISCVDYFDALYPGEDYIESKIAAACTVSVSELLNFMLLDTLCSCITLNQTVEELFIIGSLRLLIFFCDARRTNS